MSTKEDYVFLNCIGLGTGGLVYKAISIKEDRHSVAIKKVNIDEEGLVNIHEIDIYARCNHPHIMNLIDMFASKSHMYYVMPLGVCTLSKRITKGNVSLKERYVFVCELFSAVSYLHDMDIYHCDLKPTNIIIIDDKLKLTDFGSARYHETKEQGYCTENFAPPELLLTSICYRNTIYGKSFTDAYKSVIKDPQMIKDLELGKYNKATDVWSVGLIMIFIITNGKHIFSASDTEFDSAHLAKHITAYMVDKSEYLKTKSVDECLIDAAVKCLDPFPNTRCLVEIRDISNYPVFASVPFDTSEMVSFNSPSSSNKDLDIKPYPKYHADKLLPSVSNIVIEWIHDVCINYRMGNSCYFHAVDLFYRCFDFVYKEPNNSQLIAVGCMIIAHKIDTCNQVIILGKLNYISDGSCTTSDIVLMETAIVIALGGVLKTKVLYGPCDSEYKIKVRDCQWYLTQCTNL